MNWKIKSFEELKNKELYKILNLRSEVFVVEQECLFNDCDGSDENCYHLYLEENDEILAYLRIVEKGISYDEISIGRVVVSKDARGRGIARKLMLKGIEFIEKELNDNEIRISAQEYLVDFYKSLGFEEVSEVYLEDNILHVEMLYKTK
ncbi:GNAT family N-acetyltransferase [Romboutsia lituseburensis]|uniref:GNAT family N-acetyltransferase n=1 Tax=Romboutsia lituseburensis TaxID=1537 RepID=UPI00215AE6C5|nr:GNAT family N-acetyltransferase [Romboutsia lituseburensis]MCR8747077.1 GNAT family N-acetyltransferase [Romboutsia lituseburensis]